MQKLPMEIDTTQHGKIQFDTLHHLEHHFIRTTNVLCQSRETKSQISKNLFMCKSSKCIIYIDNEWTSCDLGFDDLKLGMLSGCIAQSQQTLFIVHFDIYVMILCSGTHHQRMKTYKYTDVHY